MERNAEHSLHRGTSTLHSAGALISTPSRLAISTTNLSADQVILTGEAPRLADLEGDLVRLNPYIRELAVYTSDGPQLLQVELAQQSATIEALSNQLVGY